MRHLNRKSWVCFLLVALLLVGNLPFAAAQDFPDRPLNTVTVTVYRPDPSQPGGRAPVAGVHVGLHSLLNPYERIYLETDAQGRVVYADDPPWLLINGMYAIFLPSADELMEAGLISDPAGYIYDDYLQDEHGQLVLLDQVSHHPQYEINLEPKVPGGPTAGVRVQKIFYPEQMGGLYQLSSAAELMRFTGPVVAGYEFKLFYENINVGPDRYYLQEDGSFAPSGAQDLVLVSDEVGQVKFPVFNQDIGDAYRVFFVEELMKADPASPLPIFNPMRVELKADTIMFSGQYMINNARKYTGEVHKTALLPNGEKENLLGGKFVIYKKDENGKPLYLKYFLEPARYKWVAEGYVENIDDAHVFTAQSMALGPDPEDQISFVVPALTWGETYYVHELEAPPGYLKSPVDVSFVNNIAEYVEYIHHIRAEVVNQRDPDTLLISKVDGRPLSPWDVETWWRALPGAQFVLAAVVDAQGQPVNENNSDSMAGLSFLIGGDEPAFAGPFLFSDYPLLTQLTEPEVDPDTRDELIALCRQLAQETVYTTDTYAGAIAINTRDSEGQPLFAPGGYAAIEVKTPTGYEHNPQIATLFLMREGEATTVEVPNTRAPSTVIIKKFDTMIQRGLEGAVFHLKTYQEGRYHVLVAMPQEGDQYEDVFVPEDELEASGKQPLGLVTDADGRVAVGPLFPGYYYYIEEIITPEGYAQERYTNMYNSSFELDQAGVPDKLDIGFTNQKLGPVPVRLFANKLLDNRAPEAGQFTFDLYQDGKVIATAKNDENGLILFDPAWVTPGENGEDVVVQLRERIPEEPDGYVYDQRVYDIRLKFLTPLIPTPRTR